MQTFFYIREKKQINAQLKEQSQQIEKLEKEAKIQVVFVVVSHVENSDPFRVAQDIGNKYGVGNKNTDRGLVVVVAVDDRKYFIAPGEGLEGDLTDVECDDIARACIVKIEKRKCRRGNASLLRKLFIISLKQEVQDLTNRKSQ